MVGTPSPKTMRVIGQLKKRRVVILKDTGSTQNFVDTTVASKFRLMVQQFNPMQVRIANGDMVSSEGMCNAITLQVQGTNFVFDLFTLELGGCDIVLGIQWLLSLGPVL